MKRRGLIVFTLLVTTALSPLVCMGIKRQSEIRTQESLISAVRQGNVAAVRALLDQGADPNTRLHRPSALAGPMTDKESDEEPTREPTVLMLAAMHGDRTMVKVLLDAGADPKAKDNMGSPTSDWAISYPEIERLLKSYPH